MFSIIKIFLSYLIKIIHIIYIIISVIGPYIFNDVRLLLILTGFYILTISQWYLFNKCLLTDIENLLAGEKTALYKDGDTKSFIILFLQRNFNISENILYYTFISVPIINSIVCLIKVYLIYSKKLDIPCKCPPNN